MDQKEIISMLDTLYSKSVKGVPKVSQSIEIVANDYLRKSKTTDEAVHKFINGQITKCTTSGFLTGLGGLITLPIAVPANVTSVLYVQMRMIAGIAYMGGYNINSDQVQTLVYACLAGIFVGQILKQAGKQFGMKLSVAMIKKIPGAVLKNINQKVGFRFLTKFGQKGIINLGKGVPWVGGIISGGFDFAETKIISKRAYDMFIKGDLDVGQ